MPFADWEMAPKNIKRFIIFEADDDDDDAIEEKRNKKSHRDRTRRKGKYDNSSSYPIPIFSRLAYLL